MNRLPMSRAAASLLRALLARKPEARDRILLTDCRSTDWQSLTFVGERHEMMLRITGSDAQQIYEAITGDLSEVEFPISGRVLADVAVFGAPARSTDGSISFAIEALTIED